jgi:hypothetical protein
VQQLLLRYTGKSLRRTNDERHLMDAYKKRKKSTVEELKAEREAKRPKAT